MRQEAFPKTILAAVIGLVFVAGLIAFIMQRRAVQSADSQAQTQAQVNRMPSDPVLQGKAGDK
jgi:hypothetical protein